MALWSKDDHSLWLNSEALRRADGDLAVPGGVVEIDEAGEPTGVLREESAWRFAPSSRSADDEYVDAMRAGIRPRTRAGSPRSTTRTAGWRTAALAAATGGSADAARLAVVAPRAARRARGAGPALRVRRRLVPDRVPESVHGRRPRFGTAWLLDGSGVRITSGEELADVVGRAARAGWPVAVHAIGDRANREALDAFEATRGSGGRAACASASSTPSA